MSPAVAADGPASGSRASRRRGGRRIDSRGPDRLELLPPAVLLVAATLLGGSANPIGDMLIDWLAVLLLATLAIRFDAATWRRSRLGWLVALVTVAIAAIELVPLPYALWGGLPGRPAFAAVLDAVHLSGPPRPLSLDPNATVATLVQVLPGIAIFTAVLAASGRTRSNLTTILIAATCVCAALGSLQISGQTQFYLYDKSDFGDVTGLFANHNHAGDFMLIGIALLAGHFRDVSTDRSAVRILIGALMLTLAIGVLLTASRFDIILLAVEAATLMIFLNPPATARGWARTAIVLAACAAAAGLLTLNVGVMHALNRFNDFSGDLRADIWRRTTTAAIGYWPVGSGLGTFVPVYTRVEILDTMPTEIVNHAHNEYLELFCELGLIGVVLILGYVASLATRIVGHVRQRSLATILPALCGILVLLASSAVEFPLRNESLMVSFGLLNGLVFCAMRQRFLNNP